MSFTILDALVIFGIILSVFLVILILSSKSFRSDTHLWFALSILSLDFCLAYTYFEDAVPANGILEIISWDFLFPLAFMIYAFKAIKDPWSNSKLIGLLAIPCLLFSGIQISSFFLDFDFFYWLADDDDRKLAYLIEAKASFFILFSIALTGFTYYKIRTARDIYPQERRWLSLNSLFLLLFLVGWIVGEPISLFFDIAIWSHLLVMLAIFLIVITYYGVHHLNISEQRRQINDLQTKEKVALEEAKPESISLSPKTGEKIQRLGQLMKEDLIYRNPRLNRTIVAEALGISEGYLSEVLKNGLQTNFNDYVNEFRVQHVIEMFKDRQFDLFSIEAIGFEAGFKTKSVFYSAFKKVTKKTPGAYRKSLNPS